MFFLSSVAPDKVTIKGKKQAKVGDTVKLTCKSGNSNPPASIQWLVDGVEVRSRSMHSVSRIPERCCVVGRIYRYVYLTCSMIPLAVDESQRRMGDDLQVERDHLALRPQQGGPLLRRQHRPAGNEPGDAHHQRAM